MELLNIFNEHHEWQLVASRHEAHAKGLWHETFHCWLYDDEHLYFQLRSKVKKDYPSLFDITAAGHLEAHETPLDGLREVEEELGLRLSEAHVQKIGVIAAEIHSEAMIDREFCHVFLTKFNGELSALTLQQEEVAGIVKARLDDLSAFLAGDAPTLFVEGFYEEHGERLPLMRNVTKQNFVSFRGTYVETVVAEVQKQLQFI